MAAEQSVGRAHRAGRAESPAVGRERTGERARSRPSRRRTRGQAGETLVESILAITILALVAVVAYAGLQTSVTSSAQHKESAVAETLLRTTAERLQDPTSDYVELAGCGGGDYPLPAAPDGYALGAEVSYWQPPAGPLPGTVAVGFGPSGDCPAADPGLQQITLTVATPSGFDQSLDVVKRRG